MHLDDMFIPTADPEIGDHPFEPMSAEFLAHCRKIIGDRTERYGVEEGLADLRDIFTRKLAKRTQPGEKVLLAATMMVALHDAIVATLPVQCVPQILGIVGHDPRTIAYVTECETLVPEDARS